MNYLKTFNKLSSQSIIVVGDVMVDSYIWGDVERISPEAPVPVVSTTRKENRLGGAANVVKNIAGLGVTPILCSVFGKDEAGDNLMETLKQRNVDASLCVRTTERKTTVKTRVLSGNHQILRIDEEQTNDISLQEQTQLLGNVIKAVEEKNASAIILQDYDKGVLTKEVISSIIQFANSKSIPVLVDPKKHNFLDFKNVQLFKPNFKEFTEGIGKTCAKDNVAELYVLAKEFMQKQNIETIMITLSEHGVFIANKNEYVHLPTQVRQVADVSGAGDTVISVASVCYMAGMSMEEIARIANVGAGIVCEQPGVVSITKEQLLKNI